MMKLTPTDGGPVFKFVEMQANEPNFVAKIEGLVACTGNGIKVFDLQAISLKKLIELLRDSDKVERVSAS